MTGVLIPLLLDVTLGWVGYIWPRHSWVILLWLVLPMTGPTQLNEIGWTKNSHGYCIGHLGCQIVIVLANLGWPPPLISLLRTVESVVSDELPKFWWCEPCSKHFWSFRLHIKGLVRESHAMFFLWPAERCHPLRMIEPLDLGKNLRRKL